MTTAGLAMGNTARTTLLHYGGAVAFTALAVLLRLLLDPWMGEHWATVTVYGAVAAAVWYGGYRPAVVATVLGYLACKYLFMEPRGLIALPHHYSYLGLALYLFTCSVIIGFGEAMRQARIRAKGSEEEVVRLNGELKRRADELQTILDILPIGVAIAHDPQCRRITHNPYMSELLNVPAWTNASLTAPDHERPTSFTNCRNGIEVPTSELPLQRASTGVEVRDLELDLVVQGRDPRTMLYHARPLFDEHGQVRGSVGVCIDITERRHGEVELRRATEQLRIITESMAAPVSRCSRDLRYLWVSKPYADWINRPAQEIVGRPILDIFGTEAFERLYGHFQEVLSGHVVRYEEQVHFPRIGPRWISVVYTPTLGEDGVPDGWVAVVNDVTERKQMEEALKESQQQLAEELEAMTRLHSLSTRLLSAKDLTALADVLENAIASCAADFGNIQLYNPQKGALEIIVQRGFRKEFLDCFRLVRLDDGSACAQAMQSGERIIIEDVNLDPAFAPYRPVAAVAGYRAVQSTPLKSGDGTVIGMLSTHFRNPHRPSERDERLLDLYARHAAELVERIRFEKALEDADRRKNEFLATLAHELRNPLAPLRTGLQILRLANERAVREQAREMMERQLGQLVRLVDDLLDISRITCDRLELRRVRTPLASVIESAVETARPLIDSRGHALTVSLPSQAVYLDADLTRLAQVFSNLLNNAARYTEHGGGIGLTAECQGGEIAVIVKDNGAGIPANKLPSLFEMVSQVDGSSSRSLGGLGIGLHLVKRLVEMHGGSVTAHSDGPGRGSEFVVRLPIATQASDTRPRLSADESGLPKSRLRILIVDDKKDVADSLAMMLRLTGNDICTAYDGEQALAAAEEFRPDVVLLDIGLPKLDGHEACRRLRQQPWSAGMVIVAVTGWGQEEDRRRSHEAGFDQHMVKPVDPQALMKLLTELNGAKAT